MMILLGNCYGAAVGQGTQKSVQRNHTQQENSNHLWANSLFQANLVLNVPPIAKGFLVKRSS